MVLISRWRSSSFHKTRLRLCSSSRCWPVANVAFYIESIACATEKKNTAWVSSVSARPRSRKERNWWSVPRSPWVRLLHNLWLVHGTVSNEFRQRNIIRLINLDVSSDFESRNSCQILKRSWWDFRQADQNRGDIQWASAFMKENSGTKNRPVIRFVLLISNVDNNRS